MDQDAQTGQGESAAQQEQQERPEEAKGPTEWNEGRHGVGARGGAVGGGGGACPGGTSGGGSRLGGRFLLWLFCVDYIQDKANDFCLGGGAAQCLEEVFSDKGAG